MSVIPGLDSSLARPTSGQVAAARAAGVRLWSGYLSILRPGPGGSGLLTGWSQADFDIAREAGGDPIAFCSGWDDPVQVGRQAAAWRVRPCLDDEDGIRPSGSYDRQRWLDAAAAGLYGVASKHAGVSAAFHVLADYPCTPPAGCDPGGSWPTWLTRPSTPCGWQWQGTHTEFGVSVDRGSYDDWFGGSDMGQLDDIEAMVANVLSYLKPDGNDPAVQPLITQPGEVTLRLRGLTGEHTDTALTAIKAELDALKGEVEAGGSVDAAGAIARIETALRGA